MMEAVLPRSWKEEFALAAAVKREDTLHKEKMRRLEARERAMMEAEHQREERREREFFEAMTTVFASERQITDFCVKLDRYDGATVEALMENCAALEEVQTRLDDMLGNAHVLPDGRHVFKTRDGLQVFDEHGKALSADIIDADLIADTRTRWEDFKAADDEKSRLLRERDELHAFQAKSDASRDEIGRGDVTATRLDELDAELKDAMPEAVRRKLGNEAPAREAGFTAEGVQPEAAVTGLQNTDRRPAALSPM